jgi:hypothetical protein
VERKMLGYVDSDFAADLDKRSTLICYYMFTVDFVVS